jgi:integrase
MNPIKDLIIECRPKLSKSSVITYASILKNLYIKVFGETDDYDIKNFNKVDEILHYLQNIEPNKRKTILSALVIVTDNKKYRDLMMSDIKEYNEETHKQEKTPEQTENWVEQNDIKILFSDMEKDAKSLYKKSNKTTADYQTIQNYIILAVLGGVFIPPRRSKDYVAFKIKNIDKTSDNYLDKDTLIYNAYKTAKTYGQQKVTIPKELTKILKKWISVNPTDYLLFDTNGNKLTNVKLNQRMNKIFGKKASVNIMRHSYLSSKYGNKIQEMKDMKETMSKMGTSITQSNIYIQK